MSQSAGGTRGGAIELPESPADRAVVGCRGWSPPVDGSRQDGADSKAARRRRPVVNAFTNPLLLCFLCQVQAFKDVVCVLWYTRGESGYGYAIMHYPCTFGSSRGKFHSVLENVVFTSTRVPRGLFCSVKSFVLGHLSMLNVDDRITIGSAYLISTQISPHTMCLGSDMI